MRLPLKEPQSARYLYISPENIVHVFMPIVSGTNIGLDNTCKAVYALQEFFGKSNNSNKKATLKAELLAYKEALESDINRLGEDSALFIQKQERLAQIDAYLNVLAPLQKHPELECLNAGFPSYPRPLEALMQDRETSNLYSMVLRPTAEDSFLRSEAARPLFSVAHKSISRQIQDTESNLQQALIKAYAPLTFKTCDLKSQVIQQVLSQLEHPVDFEHLRQVLRETVHVLLNVEVDFTKTRDGSLIDQQEINETMSFNARTASPTEYIEALIGYCADGLFDYLFESPFNRLTQVEQWSIATQFLLGITNFYCISQSIISPDTNFGQILDANPKLSAHLAQTLAQAQQSSRSIEEACLLWINTHVEALPLTRPLIKNDINSIQEMFAKRYSEIKDSPHFDEFFILDNQKAGNFVIHQGCICTSFASFVNSPLLDIPEELTEPLEQARTQALSLGINIRHKNTLVQNDVEINAATLDKVALQALYEHIDSYQDQNLKETLFAQLKQERPDFKQEINVKQFLQCVAYGQQNEAESLLKKDAEQAQELLTARDIAFTDYSGRTFKCSAYEYAWWAKDSHMRFMLEQYMSDETKQELLKRVQHIEEPIGEEPFKQPRGLAYTQNGQEYRRAHFDLTPLKKALKTCIDSPMETDADWVALGIAWIQVGLPQRDVPAHIAHEYCHPMRSFQDVVNNPSLLDASNPNNPTRVLQFYNPNNDSSDNWFTPASSYEAAGLGSLFAIYRGGLRGGGRGAAAVCGPGMVQVVRIDLRVIETIDEVRTKDLTRSLEQLTYSRPGFRLVNQ